MAGREIKETEEKEEARHRKKAQPIYDQLKQAAEPEGSQGKQALAGMSVAEQASLARNPQVFNAQRTEAVLDLQQTYGNRYVQRVVKGSKEATPNEDIISRIEAQRGSGRPLEPKVRSQMEAAFRHDFSQVRVHTDAEADKLSRELGAKAFTTRKDMFFEKGAYKPGSEAGKGLLGHELTHVAQQSDLPSVTPTKITSPSERAEIQAEVAGQALISDKNISIVPQAQLVGAIARTDGGETAAPAAPAETELTEAERIAEDNVAIDFLPKVLGRMMSALNALRDHPPYFKWATDQIWFARVYLESDVDWENLVDPDVNLDLLITLQDLRSMCNELDAIERGTVPATLNEAGRLARLLEPNVNSGKTLYRFLGKRFFARYGRWPGP